MVTSKRSDAFAIWYMPEATYGVDPGIVAAVNSETSIVDGVTETVKYVPETDRAAYARITGKVDGLPRRAMVDADQVFPITDAAPFRAKGTRGGGTVFSFEMLVHGGLTDATTDRPVPPPWLQLAASASGRIIGHRATDTGGGNSLDSGSSSKVAAAAPVPSANAFTVTSRTGDAGTVSPGHVIAVDHATTANVTGNAPDLDLIRPVLVDGGFPGITVGLAAGDSGVKYNGTDVGLKQAPTAADNVFFSAQACFDRRYEDSGSDLTAEGQKSYTILILRPEADSCQLITGCRCNEFELTDNVNEIPKIKLSFHFKKYLTFGEDGATAFGGTPAIADEPAYYATWPCPKVTSNSNLTYLKYLDTAEDGTLDSPTVVRDLAVTNFSVKWTAGYTVRHSNMASEGVQDLRQTQRQDLEVKFTCLYNDDWRDMLGLCSAVNTNGYNTFPFIYWTGELLRQLWFVACPSLQLKDDPGPGDGDFEGNQSQEVVFNMRPYRGDRDVNEAGEQAFSTVATCQNKFALGTF